MTTYTDEKKKLQKKLPADILEDLHSFDETQLRRRIVECEGHLLEIASARKADDDLAKAKESVKQYAAPHNDAKKLQSAIIEYATILLSEKGKL